MPRKTIASVVRNSTEFHFQEVMAEVLWRLCHKESKEKLAVLGFADDVTAQFVQIGTKSFKQDLTRFLVALNASLPNRKIWSFQVLLGSFGAHPMQNHWIHFGSSLLTFWVQSL
jgi:hypothetical protein